VVLGLRLAVTMPTTCGFPNCKFRSRYRGADDNRHFYRVPKKPPILRERWLQAIGRTEDTIVNQEVSTNPSYSITSSSISPHPVINVVVVFADDAIKLLLLLLLPSRDIPIVKVYSFVVQTAQPLKLSERGPRTTATTTTTKTTATTTTTTARTKSRENIRQTRRPVKLEKLRQKRLKTPKKIKTTLEEEKVVGKE